MVLIYEKGGKQVELIGGIKKGIFDIIDSKMESIIF
jgi:hypothetical protein